LQLIFYFISLQSEVAIQCLQKADKECWSRCRRI